jgi:hypothetical protein
MSKKLENTFKEKLENFEMPFESAAWDQFSRRLDAQSPKGSSIKPLHYAAMIIGAAVIGSIVYYSLSNNNETVVQAAYKKEQTISEVTPLKAKEAFKQETQSIQEATIETTTDNAVAPIETHTQSDIVNDRSISANEPAQSAFSATQLEKQQTANPEKSTTDANSKSPSNAGETRGASPAEMKRRFVVGVLAKDELCEGDFLHISNPDREGGFVRVKTERTDITIPAGQFTEIKMNQSEDIYFLDHEGNSIERKYVTVHAVPQVDFSFESNIFEDGLPVAYFDAYGSYQKFEWDFGNGRKAKGANATANFYEKGNYAVKLKVIDHNNCSATASREVNIENNYNLMAVKGFNPDSHDQRNSTFMPYALTQREVDFEMVIVDPKTHAVLFKTTNPADGWDGTDQRTGQRAPMQTTYAWKVYLDNPAPGEKAIYMGTITLTN